MFCQHREAASGAILCSKVLKHANARERVELPQWSIMPAPGEELKVSITAKSHFKFTYQKKRIYSAIE